MDHWQSLAGIINKAGTPQPTEIPASAPEQVYSTMDGFPEGWAWCSFPLKATHVHGWRTSAIVGGFLCSQESILSTGAVQRNLCLPATVTAGEDHQLPSTLCGVLPPPLSPVTSEDPTVHSHGSFREPELLFVVCGHCRHHLEVLQTTD